MATAAQPRIVAEVWVAAAREGFAWYDPVAERLWARVVGTVAALDVEAPLHYRALEDLAACAAARHAAADALVYVNDGKRRGTKRDPGFHWLAAYCRQCALVTGYVEPWARPSTYDPQEVWTRWRAARRHRPRWGRPPAQAEVRR